MSTLRKLFMFAAVFTIAALGLTSSSFAQRNGSNGTTLAGYKTIDICSVDDSVWRYSGVIAVWNEGAIATVGFNIVDVIEYKPANKWLFGANGIVQGLPAEIPSGTTQATAVTFPYSVDAPAFPGTIRNTANITILNHSGNLNKPFGPSPKATWLGGAPPPCNQDDTGGCTYTQGYWGNKPNVLWPAPYDRAAIFFLSGQTWQAVMDTPVNVSQGYYQLAHQYIAATLNKANGADVPSGVQDTLDLAFAWLTSNGPAVCTANNSCGLQKDWAKVLDDYNNGIYPGGPQHCGDEE